MATADTVKHRITKLIPEAYEILGLDEEGKSKGGAGYNASPCRAWLVAAEHAIDLACPQGSNAYRQWIHRLKTKLDGAHRPDLYGALLEGREILKRLLVDIDDGLTGSIADQAAAETFDTFLDHAVEYLKQGRKDQAGVIAGVVFEDTVRRICRGNSIDENGVKLDVLISELNKRDFLSDLKAKRARASAALRTSAAHARWDEFQGSDVEPVIDFTRELIETHLDQSG